MGIKVTLRDLATPVSLSLPIPPPSERASTPLRRVICPSDGLPNTLPVTCRYRNGLNATVQVYCDGEARAVSYHCPVMPTCVFWNASQAAFSDRGCKTLGVARNGRAASCSCNHLTTFSTTPEEVVSIALSGWPEGREPLPQAEQSSGLLLIAGVLYASLFLALVLTRCRRAHQSYAFLKYVASITSREIHIEN